MITSYKYRSGASALRCLSEGSLYFASPCELNDVLEAKFELAGPSQFMEAMASAVSEIASARGYPGGFHVEKPLSVELESGITAENGHFQEASQRMGIFSSSPRPDNQPMWAHYCGGFRGACFELEWSSEVFERYQLYPTNVIYTNEQRIHNRAIDFRRILVALGLEHPDWSLERIKEHSLGEEFRRREGVESMARAVSIKHIDWQHEAEIRILSPRSGSFSILPDVLKRVFVVKTDFAEYVSIIRQVVQNYPNAKIVQLSFNHTEPLVSFREIEIKLSPI